MTSSHKPRLCISLLGPFEVTNNGSPVPPFRTRKGAALLAMLALRAGTVVLRASAADSLWPDSDPENALYNLRRTLTDLRSCLGSLSSCIVSHGNTGLSLQLTAGDRVDALEFRRLISAADRASMEVAVRLYRGPLMVGFEDDWLLLDRVSLDQEFLSTLERLSELCATQRDHAAAILCARQLIEHDPLRESACRCLMQSHAASGNPAAAITAYRDLRALLLKELGLPPAPETTALYDRIVAGELPLSTVYSSSGTAETTQKIEFPVPLTPLIGRTDQLEALLAEVLHSRLITLKGMGGIGKTRLSIEAGNRLKGSFRDGVRFVDLVNVTDARQVEPYALRSICHDTELDTDTTLVEYLRTRELLLIIDNCEHLVEAASQLTLDVLTRCPEVRVIATSRETLGIPGERTWIVPPLTAPPADAPIESEYDLARVSAYDAVRFFADRADRSQPGFALNVRNAKSVASICALLDGVPLALELAASCLDVVGVEEVARGLRSAMSLPTAGRSTRHVRHQSLSGLVEWSYNLLSPEEQQLFLQLCVFPGGFTLEDAAAICRDQHGDRSSEIAASLVRKSLVEAQEAADGTRRYRMLETVREFALQVLTQTDALKRARLAVARYYVLLAEEQDRQFYTAADRTVQRLEAEQVNLRAALQWLLETPDEAGLALRLAVALRNYFITVSRFKEALSWLEWALEAASDASITLVNRATNGAGCMCFCLGLMDKATTYYEATIRLSEQDGDRAGTGYALHNLALIAMQRGDVARTHEYMNASIPILREVGALKSLSDIIYNMALAAVQREDFAYARELLTEGIEIQDRGKSSVAMGRLLSVRALIEEKSGQQQDALNTFTEALQLFEGAGDKHRVATTLHAVAGIHIARKCFELAADVLDMALQLASEVQDQHLISMALLSRASVDRELGDYARARMRLMRSAELARRNSEQMLCIKIALEQAMQLTTAQLERIGPALGARLMAVCENGGFALTGEYVAMLNRLGYTGEANLPGLENLEPAEIVEYLNQLIQRA